MPITHLTSTSVFQSSTGNRTVTPNAATAVGDLMVLPVGFQDSSATTITTPTGWSVQKTAVLTGTLKTSVFNRTRQSGDTTWTYAPNQSVETSHLVLSLVGADASSLIVGADGTRAASGGAFVTTAPSITTTVANSRVYIIGTERTTNNETVDATVNNGFTKFVYTYVNGTSAESIFIGYKDMPTAGAVGATSLTYQNSHPTNGYAFLIAVAPASVALDIAGVAVAGSSASATFTNRMPISGVVVATSTASAALNVGQVFSASASATSAASAAVTVQRAMAGVAQVMSGATASMTAITRVMGSADVVSSVSADFTVTSAPIDISGTVAVLSTSTASLTVTQHIVGTSEVQSFTSAAFSLALTVTGSAVAVSTSAAEFTVGQYVPPVPVPDVRTLTGTWLTSLIEVAVNRTLTGEKIQHTLEDA